VPALADEPALHGKRSTLSHLFGMRRPPPLKQAWLDQAARVLLLGDTMIKTKTDLRTVGNNLHATALLHQLGQSLWLDNITRDLLDQGTLKRYINEFSVLQATRLIQNPAFLASGAFAAPKHNSDFEYIFSPDAVTFSFRSERMKCCAHSVVGPGFKRPYDQFFAGMKECGTGTRIRPRRKSSNSRP